MAIESAVYTFENVAAFLGSRDYPVSSIKIILAENAIPSARLVVDPAHIPSDPMTPATAATLDVILAWHTDLQELAAEHGTGTVTAEVHSDGNLAQYLSLKDWVVTGAGILGASARGNFSLEVNLQHPLVDCDFSSMNLGSFIQSPITDPKVLGTGGGGIVKTFHKAVLEYQKTKISSDVKQVQCATGVKPIDPAAQLTNFKKALLNASTAMFEHLKWEPTATTDACDYQLWPAHDCITPPDPLIVAVADYVAGISDISIWELLVSQLCPQWSVCIVPTYWDEMLQMTPFTPWAAPRITVYDAETSDITFPGVDPAPVAGVYMTFQAPVVGPDYTSLVELQDREFSVEGVPYVPSDKLGGRILRLESPHWLKSASIVKAAIAGKSTVPTQAEKDNAAYSVINMDVDQTVPVVAGAVKRHALVVEEYRGVLYKCAKQAFLTRFKSQVKVSLSTRLMIQSEGSTVGVGEGGAPAGTGWIIPGQVCQLKATVLAPTSGGGAATGGSSDKIIFDFYITDVVHTIDFAHDVANTQIAGGYARLENGYSDIVDPTGECNPLYAK